MYEKNKQGEYFANVEVIFQLIEPKSENEIDRKLSELTIIKNSFEKIRNQNVHSGKINFIINSYPLELNIKVIDSKTKLFWNKKFQIDGSDNNKLISNIILYYKQENKKRIITDSVNHEVDLVNCQFDYFASSNSKKLNIFAFSEKDTIIKKNIPINIIGNDYDIEIPINKFDPGKISIKVSDGESNRIKSFSKLSLDDFNFWSNDIKIIRTIMRYVLPYKIFKKSKSMTDSESLIFFKNYWLKLDPEQSTIENELLIELDQRLKKVNSRFQEMSTQGWNTERGRVYIIYGEPNSIRTERNPNTNNIRELWSYQNGKIFIFEENSFGRFYLINNNF
jgi:GWxTD domain-containing protein